MARTSKWIRKFRRALISRLELPAYSRNLRYMWRFASKDGRWLGDVLNNCARLTRKS